MADDDPNYEAMLERAKEIVLELSIASIGDTGSAANDLEIEQHLDALRDEDVHLLYMVIRLMSLLVGVFADVFGEERAGKRAAPGRAEEISVEAIRRALDGMNPRITPR